LIVAAVKVVAAGLVFACTPTAVWDGDGPIWCAEGPRIRLSGIATREMDGACKSDHPCPAASGIEARDRLVKLLGGARGTLRTGHVRVSTGVINCVSEGGAKGVRTAAWCKTSHGTDLSCAMIASGRAVRWDRYWRGHRC
jgi:endonuclease YncB( thermonuclease family)